MSELTQTTLHDRFYDGLTLEEFLPTANDNVDLWTHNSARANVQNEYVERVEALGRRFYFLVLSADWCGDAANLVPVIGKLANLTSNLDMRLVDRDENPDLRDSHLTNGRSASIPVVIVLDENFEELGWWGPRPSELQAWVMEEGLKLPYDERYKEVRKWYARDKGRTTLEELVSFLEKAGS